MSPYEVIPGSHQLLSSLLNYIRVSNSLFSGCDTGANNMSPYEVIPGSDQLLSWPSMKVKWPNPDKR